MSDMQIPSEDYKYGFHDEDISLYKTKQGLTEETNIWHSMRNK